MRTSQYLLATLKETPADAEIISHRLMLRSGMIRKLSSGLYTWLPLGLRVLKKVENIVREEMDRAGALEMLMPCIQPVELWQESGRWSEYGPQLLKMQDRHEREFCFGPTHEEVITDLMRREIQSYKQLPLTFYQIQTKFRDEIRPRFGVMRGREFLMKDAYSFHLDEASLEKTYQSMYDAYNKVFTRLGLKFRPVIADSGNIGGKVSHEFQVLADSGEDLIAYSDGSDYAANIERAEALAPTVKAATNGEEKKLIDTPGQSSIEQVCTYLKISADKTLKTLFVRGSERPVVALLLRGDHQINKVKAEKLAQIAIPFEFASEEEINKVTDCPAGYLGPVDLSIPMIADHSASALVDFVCGANQVNKHYSNVNWGKDLAIVTTADIRNVEAGDPSPDGKGQLQLARGIEVGHIFQLGDKYSVSMDANVLNESGKSIAPQMGCYGIGVSRIVAAAIEQNHDDNGIIWPEAMAPFQIALIGIGLHKSEQVKQKAEQLYAELTEAGFSVLFDDRNERPGVLFNTIDLIGIPHRLVISQRGLQAGTIEYKARQEADNQNIALEEIVGFLQR